MKREIHFLNHTSLMFEYDNWFLLLDPWPTDSLAFDGWKSFPPSFLNDNILAAFINASSNNSAVIISHGHDDHCDDVFLKTLSGNTNIIFPDYPKKGALRRLNGNGLKNIQETRDLEKINFGPFEISSYQLRSKIDSDNSDDDALYMIKTKEYFFVHANDNSVPFNDELTDFIISEAEGLDVFLASQTGIASGYPYCYPQFSKQENINFFDQMIVNKTTNTTQIAIDNAKKVSANYFISYAAYTCSMPLLEKQIKQFLSSPKNLKALPLKWDGIDLMDFTPGDTLTPINKEVRRPFWSKSVSFENLCEELKLNYAKNIALFKQDIREKALFYVQNYNNQDLVNYVSNYFNEFLLFLKKINQKFIKEIEEVVVVFDIEDVGSISLEISRKKISFDSGVFPNKKINITKDTAWLLISGIWNFESLYLGHHAQFERFPKEHFNEKLMMQLSVFGYVYQKRLIPKELKV